MGKLIAFAFDYCGLTVYSSGGVRGIIELRILRAILAEVGHSIPIQELFDLVYGTSTGSIGN